MSATRHAVRELLIFVIIQSVILQEPILTYANLFQFPNAWNAYAWSDLEYPQFTASPIVAGFDIHGYSGATTNDPVDREPPNPIDPPYIPPIIADTRGAPIVVSRPPHSTRHGSRPSTDIYRFGHRHPIILNSQGAASNPSSAIRQSEPLSPHSNPTQQNLFRPAPLTIVRPPSNQTPLVPSRSWRAHPPVSSHDLPISPFPIKNSTPRISNNDPYHFIRQYLNKMFPGIFNQSPLQISGSVIRTGPAPKPVNPPYAFPPSLPPQDPYFRKYEQARQTIIPRASAFFKVLQSGSVLDPVHAHPISSTAQDTHAFQFGPVGQSIHHGESPKQFHPFSQSGETPQSIRPAVISHYSNHAYNTYVTQTPEITTTPLMEDYFEPIEYGELPEGLTSILGRPVQRPVNYQDNHLMSLFPIMAENPLGTHHLTPHQMWSMDPLFGMYAIEQQLHLPKPQSDAPLVKTHAPVVHHPPKKMPSIRKLRPTYHPSTPPLLVSSQHESVPQHNSALSPEVNLGKLWPPHHIPHDAVYIGQKLPQAPLHVRKIPQGREATPSPSLFPNIQGQQVPKLTPQLPSVSINQLAPYQLLPDILPENSRNSNSLSQKHRSDYIQPMDNFWFPMY